MATYKNGLIPAPGHPGSPLIVVASGRDSNGYWEFQITPATYARWQAAKRYAEQHFGRTIYIRTGWNVFRPLQIQKDARNRACASGNCNGASVAGYSSHGGNWNGRDCLAIDVDPNGLTWDQVDRAMESAGFAARMITEAMSGIRGGERWHYIDFNAFGAVPAIAGAPNPTPAKPLEDDDMLMLKIGGAHLAALGTGVFRHFLPGDPSEYIKNLARIQDDWQDVSFKDLPALLATYGCDVHIWDIRGGQFVVFDPLDGSVASGNTWSAASAIRAQVAGLKFPAPDPTPIVTAVREALATANVTADIDETAIAVAVREQFRADPLG